MPRPTIKVEVSWDNPAVASPTWEDITADVLSIPSIRRGRDTYLGQWEAGSCEIILDNQARKYDPGNPAGPHFGALIPRRKFRVTATYNSVDYPMFFGYSSGWRLIGDDDLPKTSVSVFDLFHWLAAVDLSGGVTSEKSGYQIRDILDLAGVPGTGTMNGTNRALDVGTSDMQAVTLQSGTALQAIYHVVESEFGRIFVSKVGDITFHERTKPREPPYDTIQETFADAHNGGGSTYLPFHSLDIVSDDTWLFNLASVTRINGIEQRMSDAASIAQFGVVAFPARANLLLTTDIECKNYAGDLVARHKDPKMRFTVMGLRPDIQPDSLYPEVLNREIGDRLRILRTIGGVGAAMVQEVIVEGITHIIRPGGWETEYHLAGAEVFDFWVLGTSKFSDETKLGW